MASRLYYPTLSDIITKMCLYITRYSPQLHSIIQEQFGDEGVAALDAVEAACHLWRAVIEVPINP